MLLGAGGALGPGCGRSMCWGPGYKGACLRRCGAGALQAAGGKCKGPGARWSDRLQKRMGDNRGRDLWAGGRWLATPPFLRALSAGQGTAWACAARGCVWAVLGDGVSLVSPLLLPSEPGRVAVPQTDWPRWGGARSSPPVLGSMVLPQGSVQVLSPDTWECDLPWKEGLCRWHEGEGVERSAGTQNAP